MNNDNISELIKKYEKAIDLGIVQKQDLINCTEEEKNIYANIDIDGLLSILNTTDENVEKLKRHLSLNKLREIKEYSGDNGFTYLKDTNLIAALSKLPVCQEYKLLISDLFDVAESDKSLTSELHDDNIKSLYEIITSNDEGSLKESKSFAILMAATKGKICKTESGCDYPASYLDDLQEIKKTKNEDSAYAIGNVMTIETKNNWYIRNKYIKAIATCNNLDIIESLAEMATNYYAINSHYYESNLEQALFSDILDELTAIIATNPNSLESKYHIYNMETLNRIRFFEKKDIIATLTSKASLESESHMSNVEEKIENYEKCPKTLKKVMN